MADDLNIYANCIAQVRTRLRVIDDVLAGKIPLPAGDVMAEVIFVQLRKSLEEIAFASLTVNKQIYSTVHAKFAYDWNAKRVLAELEKVNLYFYPVALQEPARTEVSASSQSPSQYTHFHFEPLIEGFMTRDEFVLLYNGVSAGLHVRNPHKTGDPTIDIVYPVPEWVKRIRGLLRWHSIVLVNGDVVLCKMPDIETEPIHAVYAGPTTNS